MAYPSPLNATALIGRVTRDPELRTASTSAGERSVLSLGLAVRKGVRRENDDTSTADFFDVTVWGELAETCSRHLYKGRLVAISARLQPTAWEEKDGSKRRGLELVANTVNFLDSPRNTDPSEQQPEDLPAAA
jgi:single-strand DNA-binding protein